MRYACEAAQFCSNPNNEDETYALVKTNGHRECWTLKSTGFKAWLRFQYYSRTGRAPKSDAFNQALDTLDAKARFEGASAPIFLRRAEHKGKIYIDLCDEAWRAIEIDAAGWHIVDEPPVHFIRRRGMLPLPEPVRGASIDELRPFLNGATERDFVLMVMWLLSAISPVRSLSAARGCRRPWHGEDNHRAALARFVRSQRRQGPPCPQERR